MFIRSYITNVKLYLELQPTTTPSIVHCRYYMFMHLYTIHHKALVHWTIEQYIYNSIINTTLIPRYFHTIHTIFLGFSVSIFDVSIHHLNASKKKKNRRIAWRCFEIASLRTCRRGFLMVVWWLMASDFENEWDKIYSNRYEWTYEKIWVMAMTYGNVNYDF